MLCAVRIASQPISFIIFYLSYQRGLVYCGTERAQVVVQAHSLYFPCLPVELESAFLCDAHGAYTEVHCLLVHQSVAFIQARGELVEVWRFGRPQLRFVHVQLGLHRSVGLDVASACSCHVAFAVVKCYLHPGLVGGVDAFNLCVYVYVCLLSVYLGSPCERCPGGNPLLAGQYQCDRTVDSTPGIPSAALLKVVQVDLHLVVAGLDVWRYVNLERIISIRPKAGFLSVDGHCRLGHRPVEHQLGLAVALGYGQCALVMAFANPRQRARPARLLRCHLLVVLLNCHRLQVPFLVERAADGPVVGHTYGLPLGLVA